MFPYHIVKNQKKVSNSPEEVVCNAQIQMEEQYPFAVQFDEVQFVSV